MLTLEDRSRHRASRCDARRAARAGRWSAPAPGAAAAGTPSSLASLKTWQRAFSGERSRGVPAPPVLGRPRCVVAGRRADGLRGYASLTPRPRGRPGLQRFGQHASALGRELPSCAYRRKSRGWCRPRRAALRHLRDLDGVRRKSEPPFVELWIPIVRAIYAELRYAGRTLVSDAPEPRTSRFSAHLACGHRRGRTTRGMGCVPALRSRAGGSRQGASAVAPERPPSERYDAFISHQLRRPRTALPGLPGPRP